ncbi:MAG: HAMP domain-containing protein [Planctomycetaceae bacterium]|nr:HAMP domain-containing protein [Planctomycetaceae bacterium]
MLPRRLWQRLFLAYLWVPAVLLLSAGFYASNVVRSLYLDQLTADLEARAQICARPIGDLLAKGKTAQIDRLCKELGRASDTRITVVLPSGQVIADSDDDPRQMENHKGPDRPEIQAALSGATGEATHYSITERRERKYVAIPIGPPAAPTAALRTSLPVSGLTRSLGIVRNQFLVASLAGILCYAAVSLLISRRMSRPLEEIKAGAAQFAAGDLTHRLSVTGPDEVVAVANALNEMARQLDERLQTVLRQQDERESMLASMEEGVLAIDRNGVILSLNKTCASLLGGEPTRFQGHGIYEVIRKPELLDFVESAMRSDTPVDREIQIHVPHDRWLTAHGAALRDPQRGSIGVLIVLHDITRLRHLEDVRRDFVANVSHELRTPITSLKGFVETLLDGALDDRENAVRFLQIMLRQVNRLDAIIADLLALSRIEKGFEGQTIELAVEPVRGVLQGAIEMCEKKAAEKGVTIDVACPDDLRGEINAALLEQAVVNLLDNAIKYSDAGSAVAIRAARRGAELTIEVTDHGCGIEAIHLPRLFERFYRVDKARSRELGGTGLGLAIVKHITLAHRGSVSVESAVGVGSTFTIRLPLSNG